MIFDWQSIEDRLFERSKAPIAQFAAEHPEVTCSFFAYDVIPEYGSFSLHFDSYENMLLHVLKEEQCIIVHREKTLTQERSWEAALPRTGSICESSSSVANFAHYFYGESRFPELEEFTINGTYPEPTYDWHENYIIGNIRIVLWKGVERLIAANAFSSLRLASPFRIGYQFHDDYFVILRILNWPAI